MRLILFITLTLFLSNSSLAQIQRIDAGQYKFAKGEIEVFLVDTVSKKTAHQKIEEAGFEILSSTINPITFIISGKKDELKLDQIKSNPLVDSIIMRPSMYDSMAVEEMIVRQKMNKEEADRSRKSFRSMKEINFGTIRMHYSVTKEMADKFYNENSEYNLQRSIITPRSVTVKTTPGEESKSMKELKKLKIVESVAYIALIEN